ncbi:hypothetical protein LIER_26036 [Lithospermum erythrorhizon]|uniref:Uncharacterized protein n=1 Tax=Lithospermum erythrorhizon TaxID=34254 RepID=A0AAV3RA09_LITER
MTLGEMAGLYPNLDKGICFFVGLSKGGEVKLGRILSLPVGTLHVKSFEVSFTTSALNDRDCIFFMDNVRNSIMSWGHKNIIFVGRWC